jgi:hypothetical protein
MPFTLNNGNFQLAGGGPVANGSIKLVLSNNSAIVLATGGAAQVTYIFNLDSNGNLATGSQVFGNAELGPFGTFYTMTLFNALQRQLARSAERIQQGQLTFLAVVPVKLLIRRLFLLFMTVLGLIRLL